MHNRTFVEFKLKNVKWLFKASYKKSDSNICRLRRSKTLNLATVIIIVDD